MRHSSSNGGTLMVPANQSSRNRSSEATELLTFLKYNIPAASTGAILLLGLSAYFTHIGLLIMGLVLLANLTLQLCRF